MRELTLCGWRRYLVDDRGVRAVTPVPDSGLTLVVDGREVGADDLELVPGSVDHSSDGRLAWQLAGQGLVVDVAAEADPVRPVVRTVVSVGGRGRLERVDVERWADGAAPGAAGSGLGVPWIGPGWFAGVRHPGAEGLGLAIDVDLASLGGRSFALPPLVVGRSDPGHELAALWDEVDSVRARPPGLVVLANNWYQLGYVGKMDESSVAAELEGFGAVASRYGLGLDWYCLDDPWDGEWDGATGLWGRMAPTRFPGGLAAIQDAAAASGRAGVGLWCSPWGGYFDRHDARVAWGGERGYEVDKESWPTWPRLCPAGENYSAHVAESLAAFTEAGVGYWKIDGVHFDCPHTDHGHAVGPGGRTQQMDRFAAVLDHVRRSGVAAPILTFTSGSNPSPWWLEHADFVWRGGLDDDAPADFEGGSHERFATYIDSCLDALRPTHLPVSAVVTFSLVENEARAYRDDPEAWDRHCWLLVGRGTHHHDLYVAPDSLTDREWQSLAKALAWAKANEAVLARSRMVGGKPQAGEPYGFVSAAGHEVIACLRNPSSRPQGLTVALGGEVHGLEVVWGRAVAEVAAPDRLTAELDPFEVVVLSGRWRAGIPGGRRG